MRYMRKMKGGMIPAMLATMAGKQALSYLVPKVASWVSGKVTGKKGKSLRLVGGKGVRNIGSSLRPLGSGMTLLGSKGKCAKCSHGNGMMNKLISATKAVGKRELKNHVNYAIDSNQAGGTTAVTLSRVFKPGHEAVPKTIKRIKNQLYK
jgi:hypothetical protein